MGPQQRVERPRGSEGTDIPLEDGGAGVATPAPAPVVEPPMGACPKTGPGRPASSASARCPACKRSLAGVTTDVCPACGSKLLAAARRAERERESRTNFRRAMSKSVVLLAIAAGSLLGAMALMGMMSSLPNFLRVYAILVPMGIALYAGMCAMLLGFDQPFLPMAIRIVAVYLFADVVGVLANVLPFLFLPWIFMLVAYIAFSIKWLELEIGEGALFGGFSFALAVLAYMGINM